MITTYTRMYGVWRSPMAWADHAQPIAVCTSHEAAMAVRGTGYVAEHWLYSHRPAIRGFEPVGDTRRPMTDESAFWLAPMRGLNHARIEAGVQASEDRVADALYGPGGTAW